MEHCEKHDYTHTNGCPACESYVTSTDFDLELEKGNVEPLEVEEFTFERANDTDLIGVADPPPQPDEIYEGSFEVEPMTLETSATERLAEHQAKMRDRWFCQGILMAMVLFDGDAGTSVETNRKHIQAAAKNLPDDEFHALLSELHDDAKHRAKSQK